MLDVAILLLCFVIVGVRMYRTLKYYPCQHEILTIMGECFQCGMTTRQIVLGKRSGRITTPICRNPKITYTQSPRSKIWEWIYYELVKEPPNSLWTAREVERIRDEAPQWAKDIYAELIRRREGRST